MMSHKRACGKFQTRMVLQCAWGTCNGDEWYPERLAIGVCLVLFPKPKSNLEKCLRWIHSATLGRIMIQTSSCEGDPTC